MPHFASPAWVEELARVLSTLPVDRPGGHVAPLVIQQVVTSPDRDAEPAAWYVTVHERSLSAHAGRAPAPNVTFTQDRATAEAVHHGDTSAREAFMLGRIRIGGDVQLLVREQALFTTLAEGLRAVAEIR